MEQQRPEIRQNHEFQYLYSIETEIGYLRDLSPNIESLSRRYNAKIPDGVSIGDVTEFNEPLLRAAIERELDLEIAQKSTAELKHGLEPIKSNLERYLDTLPGERIGKIRILWTKYGPGGSYGKPGIVRLRFDAAVPILVNFVHELTHSIVEDSLVQKFGLQQADKERLIDYLVLQVLPDAGYHQFGAPSEELLIKVGLK